MYIFIVLLALCFCDGSQAFLDTLPRRRNKSVMVDRNVCLDALTERQEQFWEDVEEGLDDIENYHRERGQNIDRIRRFGVR